MVSATVPEGAAVGLVAPPPVSAQLEAGGLLDQLRETLMTPFPLVGVALRVTVPAV